MSISVLSFSVAAFEYVGHVYVAHEDIRSAIANKTSTDFLIVQKISFPVDLCFKYDKNIFPATSKKMKDLTYK